MILMYTAVAASLAASASALAVVGGGSHFEYHKKDLLRGKTNALLYVWIMLSCIVSMAHFSILLDHAFRTHWQSGPHDHGQWMGLHTAVGVMFTSAHFFVRRHLVEGGGDTYQWGKHRV